MSTDPYAAPKSRVADAPVPATGAENFIPDGRGVPAGNGWGWIPAAWNQVRPHIGTWIGLFVIFAVIVIVLSVIPFIGALALYVVSPILIGGVMLGCDEVRRGGAMTIGHLFAGFSSHTGKLVGLGLFTLLAFIGIFLVVMLVFGVSMAGMFMGGGAGVAGDPASAATMGAGVIIAMLVVLGLSVPVYMALWFSYPLIVLNDFTVGQALRTSFFACLKNIVPFIVFGVVMFVLAIVASIPAALGWLLLGPVVLASFHTSYRDVFYQA